MEDVTRERSEMRGTVSRSQRRLATHGANDGGHHQQNEEDEEEDLRDARGGAGDTGEAQEASNDRNDEECKSPTKHDRREG